MPITRNSAGRGEKLDDLVSSVSGRRYIEEIIQQAVKKNVKEAVKGELGRLATKLDKFMERIEEENRVFGQKLDEIRDDLDMERRYSKKARTEESKKPVPPAVQYLPITPSEINMVKQAMGRVTWHRCPNGHHKELPDLNGFPVTSGGVEDMVQQAVKEAVGNELEHTTTVVNKQFDSLLAIVDKTSRTGHSASSNGPAGAVQYLPVSNDEIAMAKRALSAYQ
ncbi:hypothetical protein DL89DRAFT_290352 [Linderina pennispora]|uniref:Uncharacterized protein n=1 Tax=Linderina pennispora TaxID=61395 RepID=A0A1Y1WMZ1_9FUNG|nr:uncharacterized protein DL89DRAFT_290352 [Linderina pennispora]ORX74893.1 hypothetical protein DL89DRAFT_290352 [Linderina pennispora]